MTAFDLLAFRTSLTSGRVHTWIAYRQKNTERFRRIDDQLLAEHLRIAEDWS
jgi:hypothetical protein